ncbi:phosphatidylinositol-4- kinase [Dimargaris cristalligena]|nr:phosphatidylinositol-4- kinase [Dimargaris cristalligena]
MDGLEFPDLHHQILHQLGSNLALQKEPLSSRPIAQLWGQFPKLPSEILPSRSTTPVPELLSTEWGSPGRQTDSGTEIADPTVPPRSTTSQNVLDPGTAGPPPPLVINSRQQSAILACARWALGSKNSTTRCQLVRRLLPYLVALPRYQYVENYRWKLISPEDRFVYEFTSYLLNIAAEELAGMSNVDSFPPIGTYQSFVHGETDPAGDQSGVMAAAILETVWGYLESHVELVHSSDCVRLVNFVLPSLNGVLQALEDVPLGFPADWVIQTYSLAKRLLHTECLDQITTKVNAVRRGPPSSTRPRPPSGLQSIPEGTSRQPSQAAWRYARRILKKYTDSGSPFSSNAVVVRYLGFIRNVLVRQATRQLRKPHTESDGVVPFPRLEPRAPAVDGRTTPQLGTEPTSTADRDPPARRLSSRGRQHANSQIIADGPSLLGLGDDPVHSRANLHDTSAAPLDHSEIYNPEPETWEDCCQLLKSQPKGFVRRSPRAADESEAPAITVEDQPMPPEEASSTGSDGPGLSSTSDYSRALRGLFVLSQQYWVDMINIINDVHAKELAPTEATPVEAPRAPNGTNIGWSPQLTTNSLPIPAAELTVAVASPQSRWYLAPELYVLDLLPRCLQVSFLTCYELEFLDEPFLNNILTFLTSPLARQCSVVVTAICEALEVIAVSFADYRAEILQAMIDYVNHPPENAAEIRLDASGLEFVSDDVKLDDFLLGRVIRVLTCCLALNGGGDEVALSTLHLFMNILFSVNLEMNKVPLAHRICRNAVVALGDIALALRNDRITVWCVSTLLRSAKKHDISLRRLILKKLTEVALIAPVASFVEVVELLAFVSNTKNAISQGVEAHFLREAVWENMDYLALHANQRPDLYTRFLVHILNWFVDKGVEIQNTISVVRTKGVIHAKELGVFLPVIQDLLVHRDFEPHLKPSHDIVSLMRNVWFHLVLNGCLVDASWIEKYNDALVVMAAKSPILVHESAINYLETDLEYNSVLRRGYSEQSLSSLRQTLASYLPDQVADIRYLSFAQTTFLLAIWYTETVRGRTGNCTQVLRYFENPGVTSSKLVGLIEAIAQATIREYVHERQLQYTSAIVNEQMKAQLRALLISSCNRLARISRLSRMFVKVLLTSYPQALLDKQLVYTLLELVQLVWESCQAEIEDEFCPVYSFTSRPLGITLQLPDSMSYRKTLLASYTVAARDWLLMATRAAPLEMEGLLQDYLARSENLTAGFRPHMGRSLALDIGRFLYAAVSGTLTSSLFGTDITGAPTTATEVADTPGPLVGQGTPASLDAVSQSVFTIDAASGFLFKFGRHMYYQGEQHDCDSAEALARAREKVLVDLRALHEKACEKDPIPVDTLYAVFSRAAALVTKQQTSVGRDILKLLCWIPIHIFTDEVMKVAVSIWTSMIVDRAELEPVIMAELVACWAWIIRHRQGLFTDRFTPRNPFCSKMSYAPSDKTARHRAYQGISQGFNPHITWILFLTSRFDATQFHHPDTALLMIRLFQLTFPHVQYLSTNPLARHGRFLLVRLGMKLLDNLFASPIIEFQFRKNMYAMALSWFTVAPRWTFSGNKRSITEELRLLMACHGTFERDLTVETSAEQHVQWIRSQPPSLPASADLPAGAAPAMRDDGTPSTELPSLYTRIRLQNQKRLLLLLLGSEIQRLSAWNNASDPALVLRDTGRFKPPTYSDETWSQIVVDAWDYNPNVAVYLPERFNYPAVTKRLGHLVLEEPQAVVNNPEALVYLLPQSQSLTMDQKKYLLYWAPVAPVSATSYLTSAHSSQPLVVQYAMRALAQYHIDVVFFYVPQLVQALRYDLLGYVEKYIFDAAQISQLFAHQIIWNMKANMYKDEEGKIPDTLKPTLDRMIDHIVGSLSGENQSFYNREFEFFGKVTDISGKLKPYIKKPKEEKKKKIDEEMRKIDVDVGVYLPSNPQGVVVDIDYNSGRPLQSHAKAPFMATFYVKRKIADTDEVQELIDDHASEDSFPLDDTAQPASTSPPPTPDMPSPPLRRRSSTYQGGHGPTNVAEVIVKQSAIFKVGDDCRQDVLALQLIAIFKNIFTSVGLDLYLFPYRVVATNPGCGMIDVIPNSISRDQLGREKVNSLYDYFITKYGGEDSVSFQKARHCFVQSVASYSLISFLLQIKDRHNGNIMLDDRGHIVHIDFGFILDISPGGINFESSPFKLTAEMINVMGGTSTAQPFKLFADLCIKAYLASRPYAELIIQAVRLMMDSGLPCFKGDSTLLKLRQRFQLDKDDREAAQFMLDRIHESYQNRRTVWYDSFQKATNGIPY